MFCSQSIFKIKVKLSKVHSFNWTSNLGLKAVINSVIKFNVEDKTMFVFMIFQIQILVEDSIIIKIFIKWKNEAKLYMELVMVYT